MTKDNNTLAFLALLRAGLWEQEIQLLPYGSIDYNVIYRLSDEQSVVGLVAAGLGNVRDVKIPKNVALQFIGSAIQIEQRNIAMNEFIARLIEQLTGRGINVFLVKGQGIAQCYERPLWRAAGDVDLLLDYNNYLKAISFLSPKASFVEKENEYNREIGFHIDSWLVELHGSLRCGLWNKLDLTVDEIQNTIIRGTKNRIWANGKTDINLPQVNEDLTLIFIHILEHFFKEGIGFRQICDWCRLMWSFHGRIDVTLLESRLQKMGIMTEWKAFAALASGYLGMPADAIPLYSESRICKIKAKKILKFIFVTGNFGHKRDYTYFSKYPYYMIKTISFFRHIKDTLYYCTVFPVDSIKVLFSRIKVGLSVVID